MLDHVGKSKPALAFLRPHLARREKPAETSVGGTVGRIAQQARRILEIELGADHETEAGLLGGDMRAYDAGKRVAVRDGDGGEPEGLGGGNQLVGMRGAGEKREIARHLQLGIGRRPS